MNRWAALLALAVPGAFAQVVELNCELDNTGFAVEARKYSPTFGTLLFTIDVRRKTVAQSFGLYSDTPILVTQWNEAEIVFEQPMPLQPVGQDDDVRVFHVTRLNRLTGSYMATPEYRAGGQRLFGDMAAEEALRRFMAPHPQHIDRGTCRPKRQAF